MNNKNRQLLKASSLFSSCAAEDLDEILALSGLREVENGEPVFLEGDSSGCLYMVQNGEIVIRRGNDEGHEVDIARFLKGDFFGELDMFTGEDRNASAYAVRRASLLVFPREGLDFDTLTELSPRTRARLLHSFLVQISARIRNTNELVKENSPVMQELKKQVYVDKLTGLFNRTCFEEELEKIAASHQSVGLIMYKPDNFKTINDTCGHEAGDKVLRLVAARLAEWVPDRNLLFRYMGNENVLIVPNSDKNSLRKLAEDMGKFLRNLSLAQVLGKESLQLSVSFGLALSPLHASNAVRLPEIAHPLTLEGRRRGGNSLLFPEDGGRT